MSEATIKLPPRLFEQAQNFVEQGWFADVNSLVVEAVRRYLEAHRAELIEHFIREDIEWGLRGDE